MPITDIVVSGKLFQDDGDPVEGATVQLLETGTATVEATYSGGTTAAGLWTLTETSLDTTYDVKISSGGSVRYILWSDEIHLKGVDTSYLKIRGASSTAALLYFIADAGDDNSDIWTVQAADGGAFTFESFASGSTVAQLTITPNSTVASSSVIFPGILDVNGSVDWDVTDVQVDSSGDIDLVSTNDAAAAIYLRENAGTSGTIKIHADQGTSESSIQLLSDVGGVDINAATGKDVDVAGGTVNLTSSDDAASAIYLRANAGTSETIVLHADQGTGTGSIELLSDAGGVELDAGTDIILDAGGADIFLKDDGTLFGTLNNNSGELLIKSSSSDTTAATFAGANVTFAGTVDATTDFTVGSTVITDDSIVMTPSTSDTVTIAGATHGILNVTTVDDAGTAADVNIDADGEIVIDAADAAGAIFKIAGTAQLSIIDGSILPTTDNDIDLGSDSYQFKDVYINGTLEADAITIGGTNVVTGSLITTLGTISAGVWNGTAITGAYINDDIISGQDEITSGLAAADELLYSDGGTVKKIGLDNFIEIAPTLATEDAIADGDYMLFLDGGASGNMNKEAVHDLATLFAGTGLTASSSVIGVDASQTQITGVGTVTTGVWNAGAVTSSGAITTTSSAGIDINPGGSDADTDLITVGVDGAPKLYWDESENAMVSEADFRVENILYIGSGSVGYTGQMVRISDAFAGESYFNLQGALTIPAGNNGAGMRLRNSFTEASSGTHNTIATLQVEAPTVTDGGGSEAVTNLATLYISGAPTAGTTPTNGPYAIFVAAGESRFDGNVDLNSSGELLNVAASGNDWTANALSLSSSNTGNQTITLENTDNDAGSNRNAFIDVKVGGTTTTGDPYIKFSASGGNTWAMGMDNSAADIFVIGDDPSLGVNDALRITAASPPVTSYNTTHPTGTFDYVCAECGDHSDSPFYCHGEHAKWHDDVVAFRSMVLRDEDGINQMVKMGVMYRSENNYGEQQVFTNLGADFLFVGAMAFQNRERMDAQNEAIDARLKRIEQALGA